MNPEGITAYEQLGGRFPQGPVALAEAVRKIKLLLFDWDGVFNDGSKTALAGSGFSEVDSLGTNLLRYGIFLHSGRPPHAAILSGARNETAEDFARREHFEGVWTQFRDKSAALDAICSKYEVRPEEVGFFFDDVLDLEPASRCGLRVFLGKLHSPSLERFVTQKRLADYMPKTGGGSAGVREACDVLLEALGLYDRVIEDRMHFSPEYLAFWELRQRVETEVIRA